MERSRAIGKQHYGAIAAVIAGYLVCRLASYDLVHVLGELGGRRRTADGAIGAVFGAIPFVVLFTYAVARLRGVALGRRRSLRAVAAIGWLFAGGVMGLLPYSRFGTEINLVHRERVTAPGFLHALDVTLVVGLLGCVVILLLALRTTPTSRSPR